MEESLVLLNHNIIIEEICDDVISNGVSYMYDADSPYMVGRVVNRDIDLDYLSLGDIVVVKRYAKEEFTPGYYFISDKDLRGMIDPEIYESTKSNNKEEK